MLPMIETLIYVGQKTDGDEGRLWLFKEPERATYGKRRPSDDHWLPGCDRMVERHTTGTGDDSAASTSL